MMGYPQPPQWRPPEEMHKDAARSFLSGFAGCLGVGLAIAAVIVVLIVVAAIASSH